MVVSAGNETATPTPLALMVVLVRGTSSLEVERA